jgi:hypothetical protein
MAIQLRGSARSRWALIALAGLGALAAICLACAAGAALLNAHATAPSASLPATFCAGLSTMPRLQVGVSWHTPLSSRLSPLAISPYAACLNVPYAWFSPYIFGHAQDWLFPP